MTGLSVLVPTLPLPLAQILARSLNAKSAEERHNCAYYLGEASLKLCCAGRTASWFRHRTGTDRLIAMECESLLLPTTGDWLRILRVTSRSLAAMAQQGDRELPLADADHELSLPRPGWQSVPAFLAAAASEGVLSSQVASDARDQGVLGFFGALVAYRNRVIGHGAQRVSAFYEKLGPLLLGAVAEVLQEPSVLAGCRLVRAVPGDGDRTGLELLTGLHGVPIEPPPADLVVARGQVYLSGNGFLLALDPLIVHGVDDLRRERIGFLNGTVRRVVREDGDLRIRRVDYLDYATGEVLGGLDTHAAVERFVASLRGRGLSTGEREDIERRSVDRAVSEGEERVSTGEILDDFEVEKEIGRGGMGAVYLARQLGLDRHVALKVLHPAFAGDAVMTGRFRRETRALGLSDHPNVVRILASGRDGDRLFFAMEYVQGADLARVTTELVAARRAGTALTAGLLRTGVASASGIDAAAVPGSASEAASGDYHKALARLFAGAARGLAHLHARGVIHRDVKPGNLMLTADARALVITDLGLAKMGDVSRDLSRSQTGFLGTLRYMAPEQLQRSLLEVDARADIYGLGAALYESATLQPLFDGDTEQRLVQQVLVEDPVAPRRANPDLPRDLASIISVATAKRAADRYPSAEALADDLDAFAADYPIRAHPPGTFRRAMLLTRRHPVPVVIAAACLAIAAVVAVTWPGGPKVETRPFAHFHERWGAMEGLDALDNDAESRRGRSYRFETADGRTRTVSLVNGSGQVTNDDEGLAVWRHEYTEAGRLYRIVCEDRQGNVVKIRIFDWAKPDEVAVRILDRFGAPLKSPEGDPQNLIFAKQGPDVFGSRLAFDAQGLVIRRTFHSAGPFGQPRQNEDGTWGMRFEREAGQVQPTRVVYLGPDGSDLPNRLGIAGYTVRRDKGGNVIEQRYYAPNGQPALAEDLSTGFRAMWDEWGNLVDQVLLGPDGEPTLSSSGYARRVATYDDHGNWTEVRYFDETGRPTLFSDGSAGWRAQHDERGNETRRDFFGVHDEPIILSALYSSYRAEYDSRGNLTAAAFVDSHGRPTLDVNGVAGWRAQLDPRGRRVRMTMIGVEGRPVRDKKGVAIWTARYDDAGNESERSFLDPDGRPTPGPEGCSTLRKRYDERGNMVSFRCLGVDGEPALHSNGHAGTNVRFDDSGHLVEEIYLGTDGRPAAATAGPARLVVGYDRQGFVAEFSCFDSEGRPTTFKKTGAARFLIEHDERGREVRHSFFGADGRPSITEKGFSSHTFEYDLRGNRIAEAFFGPDGAPVLQKEGYAASRGRYDGRGRQIEVSYHGLDGTPTLGNEGYAISRYVHDERGRVIAVDFLGVDGQPILQQKGYAGMRTRYDGRGNVIEQTTVGVDGRATLGADGYATRRALFDERDREIEITHSGTDGSPIVHRENYWKKTSRYDERGWLIEIATFGVDEQPAASAEGYARRTQRFDEKGNVIGVAFFGTAGQPAPNRDGAYGWRADFDPRGIEVRRTYLGPDGRPAPILAGYASEVSELDERGRLVAMSYLDVEDRLVRATGGYARVSMRYSRWGDVSEMAMFGPDGGATTGPAGWSISRGTFDERGNRIEASYFGADGLPLAGPTGIARIRFEFDSFGREIAHTYFDANGERLTIRNGFWRHTVQYDERGNVVEERYFDASGAPTMTLGGYHLARTTRDVFGIAVRQENLDVEGRVVYAVVTDGRRVALVDATIVALRHGRPELFRGSRGIVVTGLVEGGSGAQAGIQVGDILVAYDGHGLTAADDLVGAVARAGERNTARTIPVVLVRNDRNLTVQARPGRLGVMFSR